jgi:hypothetical protein
VKGTRGAAALESVLRGSGAPTRAKVAEALATHPEALERLRTLASDPDAAVRANALWSLGHVGTSSDVTALALAVGDRDVTAAANAVGALVHLAARHDADIGAALCEGLADDRSYVVVNSLIGLSRLGADCEGEPTPAWLLRHHPEEEVRLAAADLVRHRPRTDGAGRGPLSRCAERDISGRVASACAEADRSPAAAGAEPSREAWVSVLVHRSGERQPAPRLPFSLRLPSGLIRSGSADRSGRVSEAHVEPGELRLVRPAPFVR